jgi:translation initiation factor 2 beta subunit (eIF-2beta)/eIF-5
LVRLVEKELPTAIDNSDQDKLEINLTVIDKKFYDQINQLIDTYLKVRETNQENLNIKKGLK